MSSSFEKKKNEFAFREDELHCKYLELQEEHRKLYEEEKTFELEYIENEGNIPREVIKTLREVLQTIGKIVNSSECHSATISLIDEAPIYEDRLYDIQIVGKFVAEFGEPQYLHYDIYILTINQYIREIVRKVFYDDSFNYDTLVEPSKEHERNEWKKTASNEKIIVMDY